MIDTTPALDRAVGAARSLKPGTYASVEALAVLALATRDASYLAQARETAASLKAGTWDAVRALSLLAIAERELS